MTRRTPNRGSAGPVPTGKGRRPGSGIQGSLSLPSFRRAPFCRATRLLVTRRRAAVVMAIRDMAILIRAIRMRAIRDMRIRIRAIRMRGDPRHWRIRIRAIRMRAIRDMGIRIRAIRDTGIRMRAIRVRSAGCHHRGRICRQRRRRNRGRGPVDDCRGLPDRPGCGRIALARGGLGRFRGGCLAPRHCS